MMQLIDADWLNARLLIIVIVTAAASLTFFEIVLEFLGFDTRRLRQEADKRWRGEVTVTKKTGNC